jgi:hypothetical protein
VDGDRSTLSNAHRSGGVTGSKFPPADTARAHLKFSRAFTAGMELASLFAERSLAMLLSTKEILGFKIRATNGDIGEVADFLVDDQFKLRYLVIDTGGWLSGKQVMLSTAWISQVDVENQTVVMNIDKKRIEEGPDYSGDHTLDRDYETRLHAHYQYPPYWL